MTKLHHVETCVEEIVLSDRQYAYFLAFLESCNFHSMNVADVTIVPTPGVGTVVSFVTPVDKERYKAPETPESEWFFENLKESDWFVENRKEPTNE